MLLTGMTLFAQDEPKPVEKDAAPGLGQIVPYILIFIAFFYFMILRPGKQERQRQQALLAALKKNDEVITSSGIIGIVTNIKETGDEITIKSDETKLRVLRSTIVRIINPKEKEGTPAATPGQEQAITDLSRGKA